MSFPKQIKQKIDLEPKRTLYPRRQELLDKINEHGTFLPKSILHADLDRGFLDFVKNELSVIVDGKKIPTIDIIITTQNWTQFTETWNFQDLDKNVSLPFKTVVRSPETKFGTTPSLMYNIPNRKQFYYATVPSYDGDRLTASVYTIPQPIPVDIKYSLKIICNRMRELNALNKTILQKFASRQAYTQIKGHYIPIIWTDITDESVMEVDKRKYYIQTYEFTMMGFLIDEDEFEVRPAVERVVHLTEIVTDLKKSSRKRIPYNPNSYPANFDFGTGDTQSLFFDDFVNLKLISDINVETFDVYINSIYYGTKPTIIQVNRNDTVEIQITKETIGEDSSLNFVAIIV
jgi:hypothetical protein